MAISKIKNQFPQLLHGRYLYSASTDTTVTNGSKSLRTGNLTKKMNDTTLKITFMCVGYVDSLSGGFHLFIDGTDVAEALTVFTSNENHIIGCSLVNNISAGSHTYEITAVTQGSNTFTIPAWAMSVITIDELF